MELLTIHLSNQVIRPTFPDPVLRELAELQLQSAVTLILLKKTPNTSLSLRQFPTPWPRPETQYNKLNESVRLSLVIVPSCLPPKIQPCSVRK